MFNELFEETNLVSKVIIPKQIDSTTDLKVNFRPQEEYLKWIPQGKKMIDDYGLCGKVSHRKPKEDKKLDERQSKLQTYTKNRISQADFDRQRDLYYNHGFNISVICIKPQGHSGKCTKLPCKFVNVKKDKIAAGFKQKIIAGMENDGGGDGAMNRAGNRWWVIQLHKEIHRIVKAYGKEHGLKTKELSVYVHQNLASGPYMATLATFDMLAQCSQVEGFDNYVTLEPGMRPILDQRYRDLVRYFETQSIYIDTNGKPTCPTTQEIIECENFGRGRNDPKGMQFGHVEPKVFDNYMTKPYNVCLISRRGNGWQGNDTIKEWEERTRQSLSKIDEKRQLNDNS